MLVVPDFGPPSIYIRNRRRRLFLAGVIFLRLMSRRNKRKRVHNMAPRRLPDDIECPGTKYIEADDCLSSLSSSSNEAEDNENTVKTLLERMDASSKAERYTIELEKKAKKLQAIKAVLEDEDLDEEKRETLVNKQSKLKREYINFLLDD
jgi:hypothetical protein